MYAALSQTNVGIKIWYRIDRHVFDLRRLMVNTKVRKALVHNFLFADDCMFAAHSEDDLQHLTDYFSTASKAFGLTISIKKTEVLHQATPLPAGQNQALRSTALI